MFSEVAVALVRPPLEAGAKPAASMATLLHSNNEPVAVTSPEPISFLRPPSKPESNLSSIASAGLHISRSHPSQMTSPSSTPADRPAEQDREAERNSSQVAREALGASEKSPGPSIPEPTIHASPEQMQVDTYENDTPSDPYGSAEHNHNSYMHSSTVASPGPIEESASQDGDRPRPRGHSNLDHDGKSFSYPMPTGGLSDPRRGLSLPTPGYGKGSPRSPSTKKHRCPYCSTEFTRQHNLKSHLLTHSQEKPFVCQTCQSRFRRLHDLKRHTKLHTGERPHTCPKCGRRFARGDALARHNKGQGGCAGRRASMGSFAPEDDYGDGHPHDDTMEGLCEEPERMDEEDERRLNISNHRKHDADPLHRSDHLHPRPPSSTYPPIAARAGHYPPTGVPGGSGASVTASSQPPNMTFPPAGHTSGLPIFTPPNVSDSPKALSPNALSHHDSAAQSHRAHSPGMGQSLPHPQSSFGRSGSLSNHAPPGLELPPPQPSAPHLPPPVISSPDARIGLQTNKDSHLLSKFGPDRLSATSGDSGQVDELWAYVRAMHKEITVLRSEVAGLRAQIASSNQLTAPPSVEVNQANSGPR